MLFLFFILIVVISFIISILTSTIAAAYNTGATAVQAAVGGAQASATAESKCSSLARRPNQQLQHRTPTAAYVSELHPPESRQPIATEPLPHHQGH